MNLKAQKFRSSETWKFENWFVQWKNFSMKIDHNIYILNYSISNVENFYMNFELYIKLTEIYQLLILSVDLIKNWECDWLILTDFITADYWKSDISFKLTAFTQLSSCLDESWKILNAHKKLLNEKISDNFDQKLMILNFDVFFFNIIKKYNKKNSKLISK